MAQLRQSAHGPGEREIPKAKDHPGPHDFELRKEERKAVADLLGGGPVLRRGTADDGAQENAAKYKPVVRGAGKRLACEPGPMEGAHEEIAGAAGAIAGEHPPCAVGPMGRRS